jgi:hypothetical protein
MKICDSSKDGEVRLLFVAQARAVGDGERALFRRQFGGEVDAGDPGAVDAGPGLGRREIRRIVENH